MPEATAAHSEAAPLRRQTRPSVRLMDAAARAGITIGGVAVIVAVLGIMVYLLAETAPLFRTGSAGEGRTVAPAWGPVRPLLGVVDEYAGAAQLLVERRTAEGAAARWEALSLDTAELFPREQAVTDAGSTVCSDVGPDGAFALGLPDGSVQLGRVGFASSFITDDAGMAEFKDLEPGAKRIMTDGYVERAADGKLRRTITVVDLADPVALEAGTGAVKLIDYQKTSTRELVAAMREDGTTVVNTVRRSIPLGGGKPRIRLTTRMVLTPEYKDKSQRPSWMFVTSDGSHVLMVHRRGAVDRCGLASDDAEQYAYIESIPFASREITSARMLLGGQTLVLGMNDGEILGVFAARSNSPGTADGYKLCTAHSIKMGEAPITALGISWRDRTFIAGDDQGEIALYNMTSHKLVARARVPDGKSVQLAMILPKLDGFAAVDESGGLTHWHLDRGHPEASVRSLFGPVWYEGEADPGYVYQSTAGTDAAEPKISLVPLIFGTLKATIFSMLFAVPIAVLAALYTSEMLHPRMRLAVKPAIEMMASLPSVVLGFVAAMVIAPLARDILPSLLMAFFVVPVAVLAASYLWQALPIRLTARARTWQHLALTGVVTICAAGLSLPLGRVMESSLFSPSAADQLFLAGSHEPAPPEAIPAWAASKKTLESGDTRRLKRDGLYVAEGIAVRPVGSVDDPAIAARIRADRLDRPDIRLWLDGLIGSAAPGWLMLLMAPAVITAALGRSMFIDRLLQRRGLPRTGTAAALIELGKFILTLAVGWVLAWAAGHGLDAAGLDARDVVFGPFNQRNTLVVAIAMSFAIIPIIYTISEDSMSSVPGSLRSASLGCGATRWQTAINVVLPLAMSGIFSACMIGLGRAVGETMIVLMATGNTPNMDWNIFSGFRTLAANIAVEMPEAPKGETHYRVLFLAGLCLFVMTFIVNTAAEVLRQRVRRRGASL